MIAVSVTSEPLATDAIVASLGADGDTGAVASFVGLCRGEGGRLKGLELEHYPGMAEAEIERIAAIAKDRWPVDGIVAVHRHGLVLAGEPIVVVAARSRHRDAAFDAVRFVMDFLKTNAPFWKREHLLDGTFGGWIEAKSRDDEATARWVSG
ncbi:MAG: molybdenum cofactor biosynthesis protein MoaE [Pseudomonadota bacterium]